MRFDRIRLRKPDADDISRGVARGLAQTTARIAASGVICLGGLRVHSPPGERSADDKTSDNQAN
jgi:hypothetical protein